MHRIAPHRTAPPSDGNIVEAMRPLHNLPVWVVLRMCTDDDRIGNFWSAIDRQVKRWTPRPLPRSLFPGHSVWDCFLPRRHCR